MMRHLPSWSKAYRLIFVAAVVLAISCMGFVFQRKWTAISQSGPAIYEIHQYITYQYNVLKNPTGLLGLTRRNGQFYLYISDSGNHVVRSHNVNSGLWTVVGSVGVPGYVDGYAWNARFNYPTGLTGQNYSWRECEFDPELKRLICWWNDYQDIYLNDSQNFVVRQLKIGDRPQYAAEEVLTVCGSNVQGMVNGPSTSAQLSHLGGIKESTGTYGTYLMVDSGNHALRAWDGTNVSTYAGTGAAGFVNGYKYSAQFNSPAQMTQDSAGNMYVADSGNNAIRKISTSGYVSTLAWAGPEQPDHVDGQGSNALFFRPTSVLFNPADGMTYVADSHNNCIRQIDSAGNVTTYAGTGQPGLVNGPRATAQFSLPTDLVIHNGFMFISDTMNNVIRAINMSTGEVMTYIS